MAIRGRDMATMMGMTGMMRTMAVPRPHRPDPVRHLLALDHLLALEDECAFVPSSFGHSRIRHGKHEELFQYSLDLLLCTMYNNSYMLVHLFVRITLNVTANSRV